MSKSNHKSGASGTAVPTIIRAVWVDDDNFFLKWIIPEMFKIAGEVLKIEEFLSAPPAMESIKKAPPDIILTNIIMSPPDGMEFIKLIREINKEIPIIVISSRFNHQMYYDAAKTGANAYFWKQDINLSILSAKIDMLTRKQDDSADTSAGGKYTSSDY